MILITQIILIILMIMIIIIEQLLTTITNQLGFMILVQLLIIKVYKQTLKNTKSI